MSLGTGLSGDALTLLSPLIETNVGGEKIQLPTPLVGHEAPNRRAFTFHSCKGILQTHTILTQSTVIHALATNCGNPIIAENNISMFTSALQIGWRDNMKYAILSYHDGSGAVINHTHRLCDLSTLKQVGVPGVRLAVGAR